MTDTSKNVLITGASSGIGFGLLQAYLAEEDTVVHAVSRHASQHAELRRYQAAQPQRLHLHDVDLTDYKAVQALGEHLASFDAPLHRVIHAAGMLHNATIQPEKSLRNFEQIAAEQVFALNAFAAMHLAKATAPLLKHKQPSVFACLSARVGSIGDNRMGGWYTYRASKAALNQFVKTLSIEWKRTHKQTCCLLLHPGTVDTALSQPFQANVPEHKLFTTQRAATQLIKIIEQATPAQTGQFYAWDGQEIEW